MTSRSRISSKRWLEFQQRYHEWPGAANPAFRLMSSMQWLLNFNPIESVGGYLTRVVRTTEGFRFVADSVMVGPWFLDGLIHAASDGLKLALHLPSGGDRNKYQVLLLLGDVQQQERWHITCRKPAPRGSSAMNRPRRRSL